MSETDGLEMVAENSKRVKHAVLVIHGMGEQHPMSTVRGFVKSVWERNKDIVSPIGNDKDPRRVWTKPDPTANSFETQRITTRRALGKKDEEGKSRDEIRVDFYEFYWAHRTAGTTWTQLKDWIDTLLLRSPRAVPSDVRHVWALLWALNAIALALLIVPLLLLFNVLPMCLKEALPWLLAATVLVGLLSFLARYFGDVARYVRPAPDNIRIRNEIRKAGVELLKKLNDAKYPDGSDRYERITVVGHSLGSIIAYDMLNHLWAERTLEMAMDARGKTGAALKIIRLMEQNIIELDKVENEIEELRLVQEQSEDLFGLLPRIKTWIGLEPSESDDAHVDKKKTAHLFGLLPVIKTWIGFESPVRTKDDELTRKLDDKETLRKDYHVLQRSLAEKLRAFETPWRISDFISIGSPLTHAEFLMARNREIFDQRIKERSLSSCPPFLETYETKRGKPPEERRFSYSNPAKPGKWFMHHAAVFAPVRWTNIYDDDFMIIYGDVFSGAVAPLFGSAVEDISVTVQNEALCSRFFTHSSYWTWNHGEDDDSPPAHVRTLQRALFQDVFDDQSS